MLRVDEFSGARFSAEKLTGVHQSPPKPTEVHQKPTKSQPKSTTRPPKSIHRPGWKFVHLPGGCECSWWTNFRVLASVPRGPPKPTRARRSPPKPTKSPPKADQSPPQCHQSPLTAGAGNSSTLQAVVSAQGGRIFRLLAPVQKHLPRQPTNHYISTTILVSSLLVLMMLTVM